jgi:hypothetical protein
MDEGRHLETAHLYRILLGRVLTKNTPLFLENSLKNYLLVFLARKSQGLH